MTQMEFSGEELEVLRELLSSSREQLEVEIHRTDSPTFKQRLQHRHDVMDQLLNKLARPVSFAT